MQSITQSMCVCGNVCVSPSKHTCVSTCGIICILTVSKTLVSPLLPLKKLRLGQIELFNIKQFGSKT